MSSIFDPDHSKVFSIPAGANFLDAFAAVLADETGLKQDPEALADALIYVPNRRSERALGFALHKAGGRQASLLPDIRALGDLETDEPPPSAEAALAHLPPAMSPAARLGALTRLVMQYFETSGTKMPAASCLSAARELARLLDQAALSGEVDWDALQTLNPGVQLQAHWQQSLKFLSIITQHWPAQLEDATAMDPYARRYAAAQAMAAEWAARPPETPVIIAGSTGATPASRLLMAAARRLPKGLVVLPGLDLDLQPEALERIAEAPSHPQYSLVNALSELSVPVGEVAAWPSPMPGLDHRQRLIHEALAPAPNTADWTDRLEAMAPDGDVAGFVRGALEGLSHVEAKDDTEEALIAALIMRETLEHPSQTAALVTPDAGLARHVSAMLKRWNVEVAPSAGQPLLQTQAGSLVSLVADWLIDPSHPVALMAVLNHSDCRIAPASVTALEINILRGPRLWQDWAGLKQLVQDRDGPDASAASELVETLSKVLALATCDGTEPVSGALWYETIAAIAEAVGMPPKPWAGEAGLAVSHLLRHLTELSEPLGDQSPQIWNELFQAEAAMVNVQTGPAHPRLAIWGPLEARLQAADRIILAGLNEGVWPAQPPADAFLPRVFRREIGLSDPDERIGLSAHDFAQLAAAPDVTLLSSQRREDKPAVASRWLWRLQTLTRGALKEDAKAALSPPADRDPRAWLTDLETAPALLAAFSAEPRPTPPLSARPSGLSVTRIEQLVRDPYAIYCEYVLGLHRLDPLNLPSDVRLRGTAIHKALERFELEANDGSPESLLALLEAELRLGGEAEADLIGLRDRRRDVCAEYLDWRDTQQPQIEGQPYTEIRGSLEIPVGAETFTLSGTADRIEARPSGTAAILDFKSGKPPSEKQVRAGLSPQMPLQGLIAREGGYEALGKREIEALTYVRFGTSFDVQEIGDARARLEAKPIADIIAEAEAGLVRLLTAFSDPTHPYLSAPRPERVQYESDYSRLARRDEWLGLSTYD